VNQFLTFSVGDVLAVVSLLIYIMKLQKWIDMHQVEHEMLVTDYLERKGMKYLPTRKRSK
jgi:hypothetical protein